MYREKGEKRWCVKNKGYNLIMIERGIEDENEVCFWFYNFSVCVFFYYYFNFIEKFSIVY